MLAQSSSTKERAQPVWTVSGWQGGTSWRGALRNSRMTVTASEVTSGRPAT